METPNLPAVITPHNLTDYQKGGIDFRAWVRYEVSALKSENAAPGDRLESPEEVAMQLAWDMVIQKIGVMALDPTPPQLLAGALKAGDPEGTNPAPEDYPVQASE